MAEARRLLAEAQEFTNLNSDQQGRLRDAARHYERGLALAMRDAGVPVGLGVDGSASNDTGNLVAEATDLSFAYDGRPIDLQPHTRVEVARFTLQ